MVLSMTEIHFQLQERRFSAKLILRYRLAILRGHSIMELQGLHLLLTYECTFECDHCFVWGSPWQSGTMTLANIRHILEQAQDLGTVRSIYFEGGEPFLYYAILLRGVQLARQMGFEVGLVTNSYWAQSKEDALLWLAPFQGLLVDLSISSDLYHYDEKLSQQARNAREAAEELELPVGYISIARPEATPTPTSPGQLPLGESAVMFRGRAAEKLAGHVPWKSKNLFTTCPEEDLRSPGRVHIDPLGNLHICQGISLGNIIHTPLRALVARYQPDEHPITGPLLAGGPVSLSRQYQVPTREKYADACHMCYETRQALRSRFPEILTPDQMYGVI